MYVCALAFVCLWYASAAPPTARQCQQLQALFTGKCNDGRAARTTGSVSVITAGSTAERARFSHKMLLAVQSTVEPVNVCVGFNACQLLWNVMKNMAFFCLFCFLKFLGPGANRTRAEDNLSHCDKFIWHKAFAQFWANCVDKRNSSEV